MEIYCCGCETEVTAKLVSGLQVYPHRDDLGDIPFWQCPTCNNFVGCHHKSKNRTAPLGCIPTPEIKQRRMALHAIIDPIWKSKVVSRTKLYALISEKMGYEYHTAKLRSTEECYRAYKAVEEIKLELKQLKGLL